MRFLDRARTKCRHHSAGGHRRASSTNNNMVGRMGVHGLYQHPHRFTPQETGRLRLAESSAPTKPSSAAQPPYICCIFLLSLHLFHRPLTFCSERRPRPYLQVLRNGSKLKWLYRVTRNSRAIFRK